LLDDVARTVDEYNLHHAHRELGGNTPEDEYQARLDRDSIVFGPSDAELAALWMPEVVRTPQRGRVSLFGNSYCKGDLVDLLPENAKVRVRYDLHDAHRVWLLTMDGVYLGAADWDSHKAAAFPVPKMDQLRAARAAGKVRRGEQIIAEAQAELDPVIDLAPAEPVIDTAMQLYGDQVEAHAAPGKARRYDDPTDLALYLYGDQLDEEDERGDADFKAAVG
jgi:putative transposase